MSKTCLLIHLVISTHQRQRVFDSEHARQIHSYIAGILKNKQCFVYAINGVADHIHILIDLHPTISLSKLVNEIKTASNQWIKSSGLFPRFTSWGNGYYAGSISPSHIDPLKIYINNQITHHANSQFVEEMREMARRYNITFHPAD